MWKKTLLCPYYIRVCQKKKKSNLVTRKTNNQTNKKHIFTNFALCWCYFNDYHDCTFLVSQLAQQCASTNLFFWVTYLIFDCVLLDTLFIFRNVGMEAILPWNRFCTFALFFLWHHALFCWQLRWLFSHRPYLGLVHILSIQMVTHSQMLPFVIWI